ncbi:MAG TPA: hypothetical protein VKV40_17175 [Ktedonobacteraceae bacterium]|nr:hypothetical protein [Ktedonobacteraceae bacterium]
MPVPQELAALIHQALEDYFPRTTPFSLLLLHVSQWEYKQVLQQTAIVHTRHRFHAPESVLEQVLMNVRRAIRNSDLLLAHAGIGATLLFPEVDQNGMYVILERIYRNVSLLQAETMLPPLRYETDILMGVGSYPGPGSSLEQMLYHAGLPARRLTLRPALTTHHWGREDVAKTIPSKEDEGRTMGAAGKQKQAVVPTPNAEQASITRDRQESKAPLSKGRTLEHNVPFMQLPAQLSQRLKRLIPHALAAELHCAPVGRDHQYLTVAMSNPADAHAISRLKETTGMNIYPVSCDEEALNALLAEKW